MNPKFTLVTKLLEDGRMQADYTMHFTINDTKLYPLPGRHHLFEEGKRSAVRAHMNRQIRIGQVVESLVKAVLTGARLATPITTQ